MPRKKHFRQKKLQVGDSRRSRFSLPKETQRWIWASLMFLAAIIVGLSFFNLAGAAGRILMQAGTLLIGRAVFLVPLFLVIAGAILLKTQKKHFLPSVFFSLVFGIIGIAGILGSLGIYNHQTATEMGGWVGYFLAFLPMAAFGIWVSLLVFFVFILLAFITGWQLVREITQTPTPGFKPEVSGGETPSILKKVLAPKFRVKDIPTSISQEPLPQMERGTGLIGFQKKGVESSGAGKEVAKDRDLIPLKGQVAGSTYKLPPLDLLESEHGGAESGDIKVNSAIIKRTLENFGIPVEISEVKVGPTVTQYALKPAEGIKLSRIVQLSNDLALALAAHPIRIEAPIPGRPLVGIEVPNRVRAQVRLRNLLEQPVFQESPSHLTLALGRDVAGNPVFADLARMPHLLVAGSTGTGKTISLNSIMLSLLYQNSPDILRFILVDPKRVEFPVYNDLPHLLTPVIFDAQKTVNALKWLVGEMERRFEVLSSVKTRDIAAYNQLMLKSRKELMPYIILVIDELADLMAARGREVEAGIVRLAQMARAVGIHLVVATQRPSVEVITGLIKANITSRIAFQVASQVDARTILDVAGAEKLLGLGDMLFVSAEISKPKRIQGAYVSEKEVRRVVNFIKEQSLEAPRPVETPGLVLTEELERSLEQGPNVFIEGEEDPLYEEAKKLVIEARKASASFLQRRLRLGYARAARLIDMLEERGVVGPGEGAKPREVIAGFDNKVEKEEDEEWEKV